jgi:hypothetical protein
MSWAIDLQSILVTVQHDGALHSFELAFSLWLAHRRDETGHNYVRHPEGIAAEPPSGE